MSHEKPWLELAAPIADDSQVESQEKRPTSLAWNADGASQELRQSVKNLDRRRFRRVGTLPTESFVQLQLDSIPPDTPPEAA
jgi:hypothetical protein